MVTPVAVPAVPDGLPRTRLRCLRQAGVSLGASHRLQLLRVVLAVITHDDSVGVQVWCLKKSARQNAVTRAAWPSLAHSPCFSLRCPFLFHSGLPPSRTSPSSWSTWSCRHFHFHSGLPPSRTRLSVPARLSPTSARRVPPLLLVPLPSLASLRLACSLARLGRAPVFLLLPHRLFHSRSSRPAWPSLLPPSRPPPALRSLLSSYLWSLRALPPVRPSPPSARHCSSSLVDRSHTRVVHRWCLLSCDGVSISSSCEGVSLSSVPSRGRGRRPGWMGRRRRRITCHGQLVLDVTHARDAVRAALGLEPGVAIIDNAG